MKKLWCRLFGHDFSIVGLTGKYEWCKRCAKRREVEHEFPDWDEKLKQRFPNGVTPIPTPFMKMMEKR
jgi:hypothetical protein